VPLRGSIPTELLPRESAGESPALSLAPLMLLARWSVLSVLDVRRRRGSMSLLPPLLGALLRPLLARLRSWFTAWIVTALGENNEGYERSDFKISRFQDFKITEGRKRVSCAGASPCCLPPGGGLSHRWLGFLGTQDLLDRIDAPPAVNTDQSRLNPDLIAKQKVPS